MHACALFALLSVLPLSEMAVPGTFFWKPRVRLDIKGPAIVKKVGSARTLENIRNGLVVIIDGYDLGVTMAALASYVEDLKPAFAHLHPGMAPYYTNMYRWALRHISLLPEMFQSRNKYLSTHKVWRKRFFYMDKFVPQWLRDILFFVDDRSWKEEEWEYKKFMKHAEPHFGKYYHYPSKRFNEYNSVRRDITVENMDASDNSITKGGG